MLGPERPLCPPVEHDPSVALKAADEVSRGDPA